MHSALQMSVPRRKPESTRTARSEDSGRSTIDALPEIIEAVNGRIPLGVPPAGLTPRHSASSQHRYRVGSLFAAVRDAANKSRTCERESCGNCFLV